MTEPDYLLCIHDGSLAPISKICLRLIFIRLSQILMSPAATASKGTKGIVRQVIGPVLDVEFPAGKLPKILNALRIEGKNPAGQDIALTAEVQQLLGDHRVRAVAMSGTDGLVRGMEALDTGAPISVPVGESTLGRIFNVCLLYTSPSPRDRQKSRMPSSA